MMNKWLIISGLILALTLKTAGRCTVLLLQQSGFNSPKVSQFLLKHIITILVRKACNALKASPSLFHHWIYNTIIYVFSIWPVHSSAILVFHFHPISILHNWQRVSNPYEDLPILLTPPLFLKNFRTFPNSAFCCLTSLAESCVIMPHLIYYFA